MGPRTVLGPPVELERLLVRAVRIEFPSANSSIIRIVTSDSLLRCQSTQNLVSGFQCSNRNEQLRKKSNSDLSFSVCYLLDANCKCSNSQFALLCFAIRHTKSGLAAFQIRSSWAQFCRFKRFWRLEKSITCVFSIALNIPTPPASKVLSASSSMGYE